MIKINMPMMSTICKIGKNKLVCGSLLVKVNEFLTSGGKLYKYSLKASCDALTVVLFPALSVTINFPSSALDTTCSIVAIS